MTQRLKLSLRNNRAKAAGKTQGKANGGTKKWRRKLLIFVIVIAVASVFTSTAYGLAFSDSQNAINGLSVYCETTVRVYHPPSPDHPFSHFIATFGIKNPSSTDVNAHWFVSASDASQNYYNANGDASFTIPRRASSRPQVSIFIGIANITAPPPGFAIKADYRLSLFSFQEDLAINNAMAACT
ncbi:MAG TPA: hypothetical protein VGS11_10005 [Candidatus Bathyarchaeia archaeon]|nr:hypothetical protein [Candidatus Bathyarchaeia archaeon]